MLGNVGPLFWPSDIAQIFKQLGNAIAVPHAVMTLLHAFQEACIGHVFFSIEDDTISTWESRLKSSQAVCIRSGQGFAVLPIDDFFNRVLVKTSDFRSWLSHIINLEWPDGRTTVLSFVYGAKVGDLFEALAIPTHLMAFFGLGTWHSKENIRTRDMSLPLGDHDMRLLFLPGFQGCDDGCSVSPTLGWELQSGPARGVCPIQDELHAMTHLVITTPNGLTTDYECIRRRTLGEFMMSIGFDHEDIQRVNIMKGNMQISHSTQVCEHHHSHLIIADCHQTNRVRSSTQVEFVKPNGITMVLTCETRMSIRQRLLDAAFPAQWVEQVRASVNGKLIPMSTDVTSVGSHPIRLRFFPLLGGKGNSKGASKGADPMQTNDPWAKPSNIPQKSGVRWDQLRLTADHPFMCKTSGKKLEQVSALQFGPEQGGIAFMTKFALQSLSSISNTATTVALLPAFKGIGNLQLDHKFIPMKPQEITVSEPGSSVQLKRLVIPVVLKGQMEFKMNEPANIVPVQTSHYAEMILEVHSNIMSPNTRAALADHPLNCFKKALISAGFSMSDISVYSYRQVKHQDDHMSHQVIAKIPQASMVALLNLSGSGELFTRQFLQKEQTTCHSIIPRYWVVNSEEVRKIIQLGSSLEDGYRGIALTGKGMAIRVDHKVLGKARTMILQGTRVLTPPTRTSSLRRRSLRRGSPSNWDTMPLFQRSNREQANRRFPFGVSD